MISPQYSRLRVSQTAATVTSFATSAPSERGGGRAAARNVAAGLMIEAMGLPTTERKGPDAMYWEANGLGHWNPGVGLRGVNIATL